MARIRGPVMAAAVAFPRAGVVLDGAIRILEIHSLGLIVSIQNIGPFLADCHW